jgi:DNA-binding MarR family transcriptional regulator
MAKSELAVQAAAPKAKAAQISEVANLAVLFGFVNKIGARLEEAASLAEAKVILPDWVLLQVAQNEGPISISDAARKVGVTRQRIHQQATQMENAKLLTISKLSADAKPRTLTLSNVGTAVLRKVEKDFLEILSQKDGHVPTLALLRAKGNLSKVVRAMGAKSGKKGGES